MCQSLRRVVAANVGSSSGDRGFNSHLANAV